MIDLWTFAGNVSCKKRHNLFHGVIAPELLRPVHTRRTLEPLKRIRTRSNNSWLKYCLVDVTIACEHAVLLFWFGSDI
jgi:hypothetical protein